MLKQRRKAVDQVADCLFSAEAAIDAALNKTAALAAAIPAARVDAQLSALYCQEALERVSETIAAIAQARRGIVETHKELAIVKGQIGLGAVALGGNIDKPPALSVRKGERNLRPVQAGAAAA
jgi:hypothetical protein